MFQYSKGSLITNYVYWILWCRLPQGLIRNYAQFFQLHSNVNNDNYAEYDCLYLENVPGNVFYINYHLREHWWKTYTEQKKKGIILVM